MPHCQELGIVPHVAVWRTPKNGPNCTDHLGHTPPQLRLQGGWVGNVNAALNGQDALQRLQLCEWRQ